MTPTFEPTADGVRMRVRPEELTLLRRLRDELADLLAGGVDAPDPVTSRLFPPTVTGDDAADTELRGLVHDDLLRSRLDGLQQVLTIIERARPDGRMRSVLLTDEEPHVVLGVLNDIRLALGARIGVERLAERETIPESAHGAVAVMDHLAWWQEQLLEVLDPSSTSHYHDHDHDDG